MFIWGLGCLFYILLCGYHPFDLDQTNDEEIIINNVKKNKVVFLHSNWLIIRNEIKYVLSRMLEKDPKKKNYNR